MVTEQLGHRGMRDVLNGDGIFCMILHAAGLLASLTLLIWDVDVAVAATALPLSAAEILFLFAQLLNVKGDRLISDADGIDGVLHIWIFSTADGVLVWLLSADAHMGV